MIAHFLGKMMALGVKNQEVFDKYYNDLVATLVILNGLMLLNM